MILLYFARYESRPDIDNSHIAKDIAQKTSTVKRTRIRAVL